ncbi:hypothetical protein I9W82_004761 [Candida metapsilosis]|uniref:Uncharacterized protein n=1 Tax=Candida metapsilosis TaxID=273372 RepID=A0A8H8D8I4_9ASCO|nr:hypothetical protein I9W82_004761 [Candida metapsilosis]
MATNHASHLASPTPSTPPHGRQTKNVASPSNPSSPVREKNSHSFGHVPSLADDDIKSIISSPKLSPDQLKSIYKNPLARRMHVVTSSPSNDKYVIPIPLTLRLPPRLSNPQGQPNSSGPPSPQTHLSPTKPKRQTLIYTSHGYEKIDVSSASEDEQDEPLRPPVPDKPSLAKKAQPPSVAKNKTKYSKMAFSNKEPDELSMIEEMSNFGSRNSSVTGSKNKGLKHESSKKLPNLPTEIEEPEMNDPNGDAAVSNIYSRNPDQLAGVKIQQMIPSNRAISQTAVPQNYSPRSSHSRCLSETSQVSSVSSFSSAGAFGLASSAQKPRSPVRQLVIQQGTQFKSPQLPVADTSYKPQHINERLASDSSQSSTSSSNSWNSLQQSVDISLNRESEESNEHNPDKGSIRGKINSESLWSDVSSSDGEESATETSPLNITRQNTGATSTSIKSPVDSQPQTQENTDFEHNGAGVAFDFPNNSKNITNSKSLKQKSVDEDAKSAKSRFSFYSNGQIEIPDLTNGKVMDQYSSKTPSSYNETVFSDRHTETSVSDTEQEEHQTRKIRVPSRDALLHFEQQCQLYSNGDESDNEIPSKSSTLYATPAISKTAPNLQFNSTQPNSNTTSPARHRRGKSMYNIDFNSLETPRQEERPLHQKSKSTDFNTGMNAYTGGPRSGLRDDTFLRKKSSHESKNAAVPEKLNIQVAEPPKAVNYAVDFKVNNTNDCEFGNKHSTPRSLDNLHTSKVRRNTPKRAPSSVYSSEKDSSDNESVTIDLTDDKYQVVTIQRSDSTVSYRSVTEKHKGKEVEVILLDDDEEDGERSSESRRAEYDETDDELSSIYSKYRNNSWLFGPSSSSNSEASYDARSQNSNLIVKQKSMERPERVQHLRSLTTAGRIVHELNLKRSNTTTQSKPSSSGNKDKERKAPTSSLKNHKNRASTSYFDDKYFDYAMNGNYNFHSFMNERIN